QIKTEGTSMPRFGIHRSSATGATPLATAAAATALATAARLEGGAEAAALARRGRPPAFALPPAFAQTVVHSDGSTFTLRVTSPKALLQLTKDTRNHALWDRRLSAVDDRAGELARFRRRFIDADGAAGVAAFLDESLIAPVDEVALKAEEERQRKRKEKEAAAAAAGAAGGGGAKRGKKRS
ncbi:hypothetical protein HK405_013490, partial [Cladochytrium tenue]